MLYPSWNMIYGTPGERFVFLLIPLTDDVRENPYGTGNNKFWGNIRRDPASRAVYFEFCFFPDFFRLFDRKLRFIGLSAKQAYFNSIFLLRPRDSTTREISLIPLCLHFTLCHARRIVRRAPVKFHYTPAF